MKENKLIEGVDKLDGKITTFEKYLEEKLDKTLLRIINILRYAFIAIMITYLFVCIVSLFHKIVSLTISQGALDFPSIKMILTDGLFTLIVLAIVKSLFVKNGFDYAVLFLEIGFVVVIRKLILLETLPTETGLLLVLSGTSAMFFLLILFIHSLKRKWEAEKKTA